MYDILVGYRRCIQCHVISQLVAPCRAVPCRAVPCRAAPCYIVLCYNVMQHNAAVGRKTVYGGPARPICAQCTQQVAVRAVPADGFVRFGRHVPAVRGQNHEWFGSFRFAVQKRAVRALCDSREKRFARCAIRADLKKKRFAWFARFARFAVHRCFD